MPVLTFNHLDQAFGGADIFIGLSGSIPHGAKIGLVGPNGIGKTTLLRILVGATAPASGAVYVARETRIGYLQQDAVQAFSDPTHTVYQEMLTVFASLEAQATELRQLEDAMAHSDVPDALLERYGELQEAFELAGGYEYELRIEQVLTGLGFDREQWHIPLAHCSGGQKTRALLARLLLEKPDLLVCDEPTNHLDAEAVEWLEDTLATWNGALLLVSHDRYFLDRVATTIWEMSRNGLEEYRGNYSAYLQQREARWNRRAQEFERVQAHFLKELDYIKRNIARDSTVRQAQGRMRRLVREVKAVEIGGAAALEQQWNVFLEDVDGIAGDKWTVAELERRIKGLQAPDPGEINFHIRLQSRQRGGDLVLRAAGLRIGFPETFLFEADDILLTRGECAALIGPNGVGKTTFLRTLMGEMPPLAGEIRLGANLDIGYFAQGYQPLDLEHSVLEELLAHQPMLPAQGRSYLARFLFRGEDVFKPVRALSGGERARLALAVLSLHKANILLLDEPTNHLDLPSQEALQAAMQHFEGTILLVSHDRYLIERLATQIWELRDGRLHVYEGGYAAYLEARRNADAAPAGAPVDVAPRKATSRTASDAAQSAALAQTEARIGELESAMAQLNARLVKATEAQRWQEVQTLGRQYHETQAHLELLMEQWETQAQGQPVG